MSRRYRLRVRETLRRVVTAEDKVCSQLELLEILPAAEMAELLAQELTGRGFRKSGNQAVRKKDGIEITVDLTTGEVSVHISEETNIALEAEREGSATDDSGPSSTVIKERLAKQLRESLEASADKQAADLQGKVTDRLERHLGDVAAELDQAVNRATAEALKRKAAQLGHIKQITDDTQTGTLTIVVEV